MSQDHLAASLEGKAKTRNRSPVRSEEMVKRIRKGFKGACGADEWTC